ncbi:signal peptidase I [Curtobacterium sp. ISL-83]|uniref:signal peptidase I n=1 Tax=Curtobacterium sp. ISL-83 TaxID=2819145 RepID=UPI001BE674E3|nr:signal peptidase I [Curtobacterium sp. ISL-83]MBT2502896.1 signal peptidase I [Curtobacterium sp. ISL-83]
MTTSTIQATTAAASIRSSERREHLHDWARLLLATAARGLIVTVLGMAFWAAAPALIGWQPTTVMTGSMEPRLHPGDVVVARPVAPTPLRVQQIILFNDPDQRGHLRLHRIHDTGANGRLITKGDANPQADSTPITRTAVEGVAVIRVPYIATPIMWIRDGQWARVAAVILALTGLAFLATIDAPLRRRSAAGNLEDADGHDDNTSIPVSDPGVPPFRAAKRRTRIGAGLVTVTVTVLTVAAVLIGPSEATAAPFSGLTNTSSSLAAAATFPCLGRTITNSPTVDYGFNAASGATETDLGSSGTNGVLSAGVSRAVGTCGSSPYVTLDGASGQITSANPNPISAPSTFTVEAWIRTTNAAGKIIGFGNTRTGTSSSYDRHLYITSTGHVAFGVYNGGYMTLTSSATVTNGVWHHVVGTMSSTNGMTLHLDGATVATNTNTTAQADSGWWRIGNDNLNGWPNAPTDSHLHGDLDDVAVYSGTALTTTQITALYNAGR